MSLAPCLGASETCFFGAGEDNAYLCILKLNAFILKRLEDSYAHVAAGEVVVCAVDDSVLIPHEVETDEEGDKDKTDKSASGHGG